MAAEGKDLRDLRRSIEKLTRVIEALNDNLVAISRPRSAPVAAVQSDNAKPWHCEVCSAIDCSPKSPKINDNCECCLSGHYYWPISK